MNEHPESVVLDMDGWWFDVVWFQWYVDETMRAGAMARCRLRGETW